MNAILRAELEASYKLTLQSLRTHQEAAVMELLQKHMYARDIWPVIRDLIADQLFNRLIELDFIDQVKYHMTYIAVAGQADDPNRVMDTVVQSLPVKQQGKIMTIADQLRQESRVKAAEKIALNLLKQDHSVDFVAQVTGLPTSRVQILALDVKVAQSTTPSS